MKQEMRRSEVKLLKAYWRYLGTKGGLILREVPTGKCRGRGPRRIDGVRIVNGTHDFRVFGTGTRREFARMLGDALKVGGIEVVEVKRALNRSVIGQAHVGKRLLEKEYGIRARAVVVCERRHPALQEICEELKIRVWTPRRKFVVM